MSVANLPSQTLASSDVPIVARDDLGETPTLFDRHARWFVLALMIILACVTGGRVLHAPMWGDEMRTWRDGVEKPIAAALHWQHEDEHAPLGFLMARAGAGLFGAQHAWSMRLGAWLCGLACVPALWWLGRGVHSSAAGLLMSTMFVVDSTDVFQLTLARMYSSVLLGGIVSLGCFVRVLRAQADDRNRIGWAIGAGVALGWGIWSHAQIYAVAFAACAVAAGLAIVGLRRAGASRHAAWTASALLIVGVGVGLTIGVQGVWKLIVERDRASLVKNNIVVHKPTSQLEDASKSLTVSGIVTTIVCVTAIAGFACLVARRRPATAALLLCVVVFAAVDLGIEARYRAVAFARYLVIAQPPLWSGIAVALVESARLTRSRPAAWRAVPGGAFAVFVGLCGYELWRTAQLIPAHPLAGAFRDAVAYVRAHRSNDAPVVVKPGKPMTMFARYYGLTADAQADAALKADDVRGHRRATTSPAVAAPAEFWMIAVVPGSVIGTTVPRIR